MAKDLPDTLEEWWTDYRRSLARRNRSPETAKVYREAYEHFWTWAVDHGIDADPAAVDHRVLNRWVDDLMVTPATRNGRPILTTDPDTGDRVPKMLEPSTQRILFTNLRPFFTWWVREQDDDRRHPFDKADAPQTKTTPVPLAQLDDVRAMLATCGKDFASRRDEAIIRVLIDTGVRRGELVGMALADWNRHHDHITVDGKSGERTVPVSLSTGEAMARYVRVRSTHTRANLPALWLGERGPLGKTGVAQILKRRCELAGIDPINPHKLRHTFSHLFRAEGGSEGDLMYLAGWTTTAMAHRYGASAASERAHDTARRIAIGDRL